MSVSIVSSAPLPFVSFVYNPASAQPTKHPLWRRLTLLLALLSLAASSQAQSVDVAGGVLSPTTSTVNHGPNSGTLTLRGYYGVILRYQADSGNGFVDVGGPTRDYTYYDLRTTTRFRAIVLTPTAVVVASAVATVTVRPVPDATPTDPDPNRPVFEDHQASFAPGLALKFSPLATQDPITSSLLLGVEYRISPRFGVEASYGQQFTALRITTLGLLYRRNDYEYQKFKLEMRRYLAPRTKNPNQETYIAVQAFFTPQRYTRYGDNYYHDGAYYTYDRNFVNKDISGITLKVGSVWHVWSNWLLEGGLGLGGRYVLTQYNMLNERRAINFSSTQVTPFNQIEVPGSKASIDVELVFKVGYVFPFHRQ